MDAHLNHQQHENLEQPIPLEQPLTANQIKHRQMISREIYLLLHLEHPRIIRCENFFKDRQAVYIVMEYAEHGTLQHLIRHHANNNTHFNVEVIFLL